MTGGNVIEFAVAVIMAGAISAVVKGFVSSIIMPVVGHFTGGTNFDDKKIILNESVVDAAGAVATPENAIMWGSWVNTIINLIIVGLVMFLIVKAYNKSKKPVEAPAPAGPSELNILKEIRDSLQK
ncbi:large conductance mechanosensitive channel protein MscL [Psychroserpens sp.]|uniref:large conductance mechanosensitive channel protein MscL n=1 Tax=Psychroserpens sp. TaxID=2020870 RepID=UPI0039E59BF0